MLGSDLSTLHRARPATTKSISPENPTGAAGGGARATEGQGKEFARDLGLDWKISPRVTIEPGETITLADIDEAGRITHIWMTTLPNSWRRLILRAYWDGDPEPAVETPYGDFFCNGWGTFAQVSSAPVAANPHGGFNAYWPMPFHAGATFTMENTSGVPLPLYFQITYETGDQEADASYFHAQWHRDNPLDHLQPHTLLKDIEGCGHYAGTYLAWGVNSNGWWGEGEMRFFLDGDNEYPSICGTGTEDYFGGAWNFDVPGAGYTEFSTPYLGMPQVITPDGRYSSQQRFGMYRWHVPDPIRFTKNLTVDIQALGWRSGPRYRPLRDDIASTSIFYLDRTSTNRPPPPDHDTMEIDADGRPMPDS
ncbi:glycoside hydrolase family 172 protein [Arthrobacter pigmenti]